MQTFLPYPHFKLSAKCLDRQRLGKQRVEAYQILKALLGQGKGWKNHPAVRMWRGYETSLAEYGVAVCAEWTARGYKDTVAEKVRELSRSVESYSIAMPPWFGLSCVHSSHRRALLCKDWGHYSKLKWSEARTPLSHGYVYVWPHEISLPGYSYVWPHEPCEAVCV